MTTKNLQDPWPVSQDIEALCDKIIHEVQSKRK